jgi:hypothetical protein
MRAGAKALTTWLTPTSEPCGGRSSRRFRRPRRRSKECREVEHPEKCDEEGKRHRTASHRANGLRSVDHRPRRCGSVSATRKAIQASSAPSILPWLIARARDARHFAASPGRAWRISISDTPSHSGKPPVVNTMRSSRKTRSRASRSASESLSASRRRPCPRCRQHKRSCPLIRPRTSRSPENYSMISKSCRLFA